MTAAEVIAILTEIASSAPGLLAAISQSGAKSDAEALDAAAKAIDAIPLHPASEAIGKWRAHLAQVAARTAAPTVADAAALRRVAARLPLTPKEAQAVDELASHVEKGSEP